MKYTECDTLLMALLCSEYCWHQTPNPCRRCAHIFSSRLLTVAIDSEGRAGGGDLVVTDLAVLWGAVLVCGLHLQDAIVDLALGHCGSVLGLPEHWGELIHIVDLNVHHGPAESRGGKWSLEWNTVSNAQIVTALRTFNLLGWTLHRKISNKW